LTDRQYSSEESRPKSNFLQRAPSVIIIHPRHPFRQTLDILTLHNSSPCLHLSPFPASRCNWSPPDTSPTKPSPRQHCPFLNHTFFDPAIHRRHSSSHPLRFPAHHQIWLRPLFHPIILINPSRRRGRGTRRSCFASDVSGNRSWSSKTSL
jgi:hypothetical protein